MFNRQIVDAAYPWAASVIRGTTNAEFLDKTSIEELTDDTRVCNTYHKLRASSLREFFKILNTQDIRAFGITSYRKLLRAISERGPKLSIADIKKMLPPPELEPPGHSWMRHYKQLCAFHKANGHCNPSTAVAEEKPIGAWLVAQRVAFKKGRLRESRRRLLEQLGIIWDWKSTKRDETWMRWYEELKEFHGQNGHCRVPRTHPNRPFASWVWIQRLRKDRPYGKAAQLTPEQVALLDRLDFVWDPHEERWSEMFDRLITHKNQHGDFEPLDDKELNRWVGSQRKNHAKGRLSRQKQSKLEAIGFPWQSQTLDNNWNKSCEELAAYHAKHGHCKVTRRENPKLATWVLHQRAKYRDGILHERQKQKLEAMGFTWKTHDKTPWHEHLKALEAYHAKHGHTNLVYRKGSKDKLALFVRTCRINRNKGRLAPELERSLNQISFDWDPNKTAFDKNLSEYIQLRTSGKLRGKSSISAKLYRWMRTVRLAHQNGTLPSDRLEALVTAGFDFNPTPSQRGPAARQAHAPENSDHRVGTIWEERRSELVAFKAANGHFRPHPHKPATSRLYMWMASQRRYRRQGKMSQQKIAALDEIGFPWESTVRGGEITPKWMLRLEQAKAFLQSKGHLQIPAHYAPNKKLGTWTVEQRRLRRKGKLSAEQIRLLDEIGFLWSVGRDD